MRGNRFDAHLRLFLAGYNRLAICKMLLEHGADVLCKDKGGLVSQL